MVCYAKLEELMFVIAESYREDARGHYVRSRCHELRGL